MSAWQIGVCAYLGASLLMALLIDEETRTVVLGVLVLPLCLPGLLLAKAFSYPPLRRYGTVSPAVLTGIAQWFGEHPDSEMKAFRVLNVAVLWSTKGNPWRIKPRSRGRR